MDTSLKDPLDGLSPQEQLELLESLEALNKQVSQVYVPHPKQKLFHCAKNKIRAVFGGNRSGKTEMGVNESKFHAQGRYPDWYPVDCRWSMPTRGRIVVTDYRVAASEVIEPKLKQWFGDSIIKIERVMGKISKVYIQHISGGISTFDILTHEQDTMQFEGWSGHWVWFDEPPPRDKYISCLRGLVDFNGRVWITATPISEPWLYDEIILNLNREAWHVAVSISDNPHISKKAIEDFAISLTDEEKEARLYGKFLHLSGRIYGELDTNVHLIDSLPPNSHAFPTYFVLDPADRRPHHAIWAKVDPHGTLYVFDELVLKGTVSEVSKAILVRERTNGIDPDEVIRILDPNKGRAPAGVGEEGSLKQSFSLEGLYFDVKVNDDVATGHLAVKQRLKFDHTKKLEYGNSPKLYFIKDKTRECVKQLLSYVWDDWKGKSAASKSEKERPKDINKDMPDCVRYLCVKNPLFIPDKPKTTFLDVDTSEI